MSAKPISVKKSKSNGRGCLAVFGLFFFLLGSILFWFMFVSPVWSWQRAKQWASVQGTIVNSNIETHRGEDSTTYSANFEYEYDVTGTRYNGDQYSFFDTKGSRSAAKSLLARHPIGSQAIIFYDPHDPGDSVMNRDFQSKAWFGLIPLIFLCIGGVLSGGALFLGWGDPSKKDLTGYASVVKQPGQTGSGQGTAFDGAVANRLVGDVLDNKNDGPLKLKPGMSNWTILLGVTVACLFWNGIVSVFVVQAIDNGFPIFECLFLTPFVLIGMVLCGAVVYYLLSLFNPRIEIALSNGAVPLGSEVDLAWEVIGRVSRFKKLSITVEGQELATYMQGTSRRTDTEVFESISVAELTDPAGMQFGTEIVLIPDSTIHSFKSDNNEIKWVIKVHGDIPYWPDVHSTMEFRVRP